MNLVNPAFTNNMRRPMPPQAGQSFRGFQTQPGFAPVIQDSQGNQYGLFTPEDARARGILGGAGVMAGPVNPNAANPPIPAPEDLDGTSVVEGLFTLTAGGAGTITGTVSLQRAARYLRIFLDDPGAIFTALTRVLIGSQPIGLGPSGSIPTGPVMEGSAANPNPPGYILARLDGQVITAGTVLTMDFTATGAGTGAVWSLTFLA